MAIENTALYIVQILLMKKELVFQNLERITGRNRLKNIIILVLKSTVRCHLFRQRNSNLEAEIAKELIIMMRITITEIWQKRRFYRNME